MFKYTVEIGYTEFQFLNPGEVINFVEDAMNHSDLEKLRIYVEKIIDTPVEIEEE